jgi:hypothetical protein
MPSETGAVKTRRPNKLKPPTPANDLAREIAREALRQSAQLGGNWVGALQNAAVTKRLMPSYDFLPAAGGTFSCSCLLAGVHIEAPGPSKAAAKREAARAWAEKVGAQ